MFLALAGEPRAEGATRIPPAALGRVLGLDRAPEVKTIRRKLGELAAAGKAHELVMALARHYAAAKPDALGFLHADGHARAYYGTRSVQKTHVARLKFPAPATMETWVTDSGGDPVFMVVAEPSESLAAEIKRLLPQLRQVVGNGRKVTVCFDRGGWSPAVFADIIEAGFDLLTWRKGPAPDVPAAEFTTVTCTDDRGRQREYDLADTPVELPITDRPRKGETVSLRQVTRRVPARRGATVGATWQIHALATRKDLGAAEVCGRLSSRWREENYFRYARTRFALDAPDSHAASPDNPERLVPNPAKKAAAAQVRRAETLAAAAEAERDARLLVLRCEAKPHPGLHDPHLYVRSPGVGSWAAANNVEIAYTPTISSWLNRIEAEFTALRYFALDGTDHASHKEQASMIRRYIIWRNNHAYDEHLRRIVDRANVA